MLTVTLEKKLTEPTEIKINEEKLRQVIYYLLSDPNYANGWEKKPHPVKVRLRNEDQVCAVIAHNNQNGNIEFFDPETGEKQELLWTIVDEPIPFKY